MSTRIHTSGGWPWLSLMTAEQIAEDIGGEWDDDELADPDPWLVMVDRGNDEAWVAGISAASLTDMIAELARLRDELAAYERRAAQPSPVLTCETRTEEKGTDR